MAETPRNDKHSLFGQGNSAVPAPDWTPSADVLAHAHVTSLIAELGLDTYESLHQWSIENCPDYWERVIAKLGIVFQRPFDNVVSLARGITDPQWLSGAQLNIAESCFRGDHDAIAILHTSDGKPIQQWTLAHLESLSNRVANALTARGLGKGDRIAIDMPMTAESVAIYLGIIRMGGAVVSIADSFAPLEITTRLAIADAQFIFTQDVIHRSGKSIPLYQRVIDAKAPAAVVLPAGNRLVIELRENDIGWDEFLVADDTFESVLCHPDDCINVLFSSGTTGDPKAIAWTQATPIKGAADAFFHHDIHPGDVLAWPTNLGWMMGPWLIFAALVNRASIALYDGAPLGRDFGAFVQDAGVTMLGLVPSLVRAWRSTGCMEGLDWGTIRCFSSTGECSNADDMRYLMQLAGNKPVIEYCGGTELGGGYLTGVLTRPAVPGLFNTLALGSGVVILDEDGQPSDNGEVFLIPPVLGYSNRLLNRDHHEVYFEGTPGGPGGEVLRRHGDQIERLPGGYYRAHGRVDDTMNLGGIKISSAEVERTVNRLATIRETAAIAVSPPGGGPHLLVIYAVASDDNSPDREETLAAMQQRLRTELNPLFKIYDLVFTDAFPRTASNKVMRRLLRDGYSA